MGKNEDILWKGYMYSFGPIITRPGSFLDPICSNKANVVLDLGILLPCQVSFDNLAIYYIKG